MIYRSLLEACFLLEHPQHPDKILVTQDRNSILYFTALWPNPPGLDLRKLRLLFLLQLTQFHTALGYLCIHHRIYLESLYVD